MKTNPFFIIVGPTCAGKTSVGNILRKVGFLDAISATTRPKRENEPEDAYRFLSDAEFDSMTFVEQVSYGGYRYGSLAEEIDHSDFGIFEPSGATAVGRYLSSVGREALVIGIDAPLGDRLQRMKSRNDDATLRLKEDADIFQSLPDYCDLYIVNKRLNVTCSIVHAFMGVHLY